MTGQVIKFKTAEALVDTNFTENTYRMYVVPPLFYGEKHGQLSGQTGWHSKMIGAIAAPTQQQLQDWLLRSHNLHATARFDNQDGALLWVPQLIEFKFDKEGNFCDYEDHYVDGVGVGIVSAKEQSIEHALKRIKL